VLAANLLCRVPNPRTCLDEISRSLRPGGLLVLTSPFTWMEQYTDKQLWVGATYDDKGQPRRCVRHSRRRRPPGLLGRRLPAPCARLLGPGALRAWAGPAPAQGPYWLRAPFPFPAA
jgi:hypothetical protein